MMEMPWQKADKILLVFFLLPVNNKSRFRLEITWLSFGPSLPLKSARGVVGLILRHIWLQLKPINLPSDLLLILEFGLIR